MEIISITFENQKPKYFGFTGVHLYSVESNDKNEIIVKAESDAITLYKVYWDLAVFLSNSLNPSDKKTTVETYSIFGNSSHKEKLKCDIENAGLKIVGYLNKEDVNDLYKFLTNNSLNKSEGIKNYYQNLKPDIQEELKILLADELIPSLRGYMKQICEFVSKCEKDNSEILLIYNP